MHNLENSLNFARNMRNEELQMETSVALGFLCYENEEWTQASKYFSIGLNLSKSLGNLSIVDLCSCNLGVVDANFKFKEVQTSIIQRFEVKS